MNLRSFALWRLISAVVCAISLFAPAVFSTAHNPTTQTTEEKLTTDVTLSSPSFISGRSNYTAQISISGGTHPELLKQGGPFTISVHKQSDNSPVTFTAATTTGGASIDNSGSVTVSDENNLQPFVFTISRTAGSGCEIYFKLSGLTPPTSSGQSTAQSEPTTLSTPPPESNSSVESYYNLGSTATGGNAGNLTIYAKQPSLKIYKPEGLTVLVTDPSVEVIRAGASQYLRQVLSASQLTDIVILNDQSYELRFYKASQKGAKVGGLYQPIGTPFKKSLIENPGVTPIGGTDDDPLYADSRWGTKFGYALSVGDGPYLVKLQFAELYHDQIGDAVFTVKAEDQTIFSSYDVLQAAGSKNTAHSEDVLTTVRDGSLNLEFKSSVYGSQLAAFKVMRAGDTAIADTVDDVLYQSERTGTTAYALTVPNATYTVTLYFSESTYAAAGKRMFNVAAEGTVMLSGYDIYAQAGAANKAKTETFPVTVADGQLDLQFTSATGEASLGAIKIVDTATGTLVKAVNAGGPAFTANDGTLFVADSGFTGGAAHYPGQLVAAIDAGGIGYTAADGTVYEADRDYIGGYAYQGTLNSVRVTRTEGATPQVYTYSWITQPLTGEFGECVLTHPGGLKKEGKQVIWSLDRQSYAEIRTLRDSSDNLIAKTATTYEKFPFGTRKVSEVTDPDGANLAIIWTYIEGTGNPSDPLPDGYGEIQSMTRYDGYWEDYTYDNAGRLVKTVSRYLDSTTHAEGDNKVVVRAYATSNPTTTKITTIKGLEVARAYEAEFDDVSSNEFERWDITSVTPGAAWNATNNLFSKVRFYNSEHSNELLNGQIKWTSGPDGTMTFHDYAQSGDNRIVTTYSGTPNVDLTAITDGTRTITTSNVDRQTIAEKVIDIASGLTVSEWEAIEVDDLGRPTLIGYGDGTTRSIAYAGSSATCGSCSGAGNFLVESETDRNGVTTTYAYDALNRRTDTTRLGVTEHMVYDAAGHELERHRIGTDSSSIRLSRTVYDLAGRVVETYDALNNKTDYAYTYPIGGGMTTTITTPATAAGSGTRIETTYADGRAQEISGTAVSPLKYAYGTWAVSGQAGEWAQEIKVGDSSSESEWTKTYIDLARRRLRVEYPNAAEASMEYNNLGQIIRQTDSDGVQTLFAYNAQGERVVTAIDLDQDEVIDYTGTDRITQSVSDVYSRSGTVVSRTTTQVWAADSTDAATTVSVAEEDGYGNASWQTDAAGAVSSNVITRITPGAWTITSISADGSRQVQTFTSGRLAATSILDSGLLTLSSTTYAYDPHNRVETQTDSRTGETNYTYTARDEVHTVITNNGTETTTYTYDALGKQLTITRPDSSVTTNDYQLRNSQLKKTSGSQTYPVEYTYDLQGRMKTLTTWQNATSSSGAAVTTWNYDPQRGWLTQKLYADNTGPAYTYKPSGRLLTRTWARTVASTPLVTTYGYNNAGDLASTDYSDTTADVAITYTRFGAQHTVTDATGTRTFTYTAALRPEQEQLPAFYGDRILTRSYQATGSGQVPGRNDGFELGVSGDLDQDYDVVYGYDTSGRLGTVTDPNGTFTYGYVPNSNLRHTITGPVHVATTTYEPYRNVIDTVENKVGGTAVSKFDYTVNSLGQRTQRANTGTAFGTASTDVFAYNSKGEMESVTNATLTARDQSFAYDDIGNRLTFTTTGGTTSYTANSLNAYTAIDSANPTHDEDGNQATTGTGQVYIWDGENRLVLIEPAVPTTGDKKQLNVYDSQNRRVRKQVSTYTSGSWSLTTDEKFIYDAWNPVVVLNAASSDTLLRTYTWGTDLSGNLQGAGGVGGLLSSKDGSSVYHYTYDANGNVSEVLNSSGGIAAHYEYDAFGNTVAFNGTYAVMNAYRFSTKSIDVIGGIYYYGFRYYNPGMGRWLSRDPIEERDTVNLYTFLRSDPVSKYDMLGMWGTSGHTIIATNWLTQYSNYQWIEGSTIDVVGLVDLGSQIVDGDTGSTSDFLNAQSQANAYQHAMRSPLQSVSDAEAAMQGFVQGKVNAARNLAIVARRECDVEKLKRAVKLFGEGMHPVMDSTSPSHTGFQVWFGPSWALLSPIVYAGFVANHHYQETDADLQGMLSGVIATMRGHDSDIAEILSTDE